MRCLKFKFNYLTEHHFNIYDYFEHNKSLLTYKHIKIFFFVLFFVNDLI